MEDCIFCKIVKGEIPSVKIYEDSLFFAFLDINPVTKGHILLIPKYHIKWIHEVDDIIISKIFILVKKIINKMRNNLPCDFVQITVVGEEIAHFHIHLIPRFFKDGLIQPKTITYDSKEELEIYAKKIIW